MRYFTFKLSSVFLVLLLIENASGDFVQVTIVLRMYPANVWLVHAEIYEPIELNIYVIKCFYRHSLLIDFYGTSCFFSQFTVYVW